MTTETVFRGGFIPSDVDEAAERIEASGCIYAHEDRAIAALYGSVGRLRIVTDAYLDASTEAGKAEWERLGKSIWAARDAGYPGVLYPDEHDWSESGIETDGLEIAIFDAETIVF
jgi:hypothetical protein